MEHLLPFFLILFTGVSAGALFRQFHLPWVIALIVGGAIAGPHGFDILSINPITEFISEIGLIFLMFMAGLETDLTSFKVFRGGMLFLSFINGFIPFLVGVLIGLIFGYGLQTALLLGVIFVSSSIAVVIPTLETTNMLKTKLGKSVMTTSIIQDIASLLLLSLFLQSVSPTHKIPLLLFYPLLFLSLFLLRFAIPRIQQFFGELHSEQDLFQQELRSVFLVLIGTVVLFELLGLHSIIGGFFAGLVLSDSIKSEILIAKLRAISYGIFIPTFFILIGARMDLSIFGQVGNASLLTLVVLLGSIISKFFSGTIAAAILDFDRLQSMFFGATSIPQLSTTLAATFAASRLGLISNELEVALILLSIVSTLIGPSLMNIFKSTVKEKDLAAFKKGV